jgi:multiple sugar transport system substrate-binding protein
VVGSTVGGAGLGVSANTRAPEAAKAIVRMLMDRKVQAEVLALHDGQPARASAWSDPVVNAAYGNFYSNTRATIEASWVRPRNLGYVAFQKRAAELVSRCLSGADQPDTTAQALQADWMGAGFAEA